MIFGITAYRALTTGITDDEASSYVLYAKDLRIWDFGELVRIYRTAIANNQWLNTFLMHGMDVLAGGHAYNITLMRLPIVLSFAVYLGLCFESLREGLTSFAGFMGLIACYYMNEFFGLARGYGYAAMFVMLSLFLYHRLKESGYTKGSYVLGILASLFLAGLANTVTLIAFAPIGLMLFYRLLQRGTLLPLLRRYLVGAVVFFLGTAFLVSYHMGASTRDTALYTGKRGYLYSTTLTFFRMYFGSEQYMNVFVLGAAGLMFGGVLWSLWKGVRSADEGSFGKRLTGLFMELDYWDMFLLFVAVSVLMGPVFDMGYITGRTAIPFLPLVIVGLDDLLRRFVMTTKVQVGIIAALLVLFCMQINVKQTVEWKWDYTQEQEVLNILAATDGVWPEDGPLKDYSTVFYVQKYADPTWMPEGYTGPTP